MSRPALPTWFFVVVVVRFGHRFLLVHERKHGQQWYLPAGRVEPGESLEEAAHRETFEEAAIPIELEGILRVEHSPQPRGDVRVRVIYVARPADDTEPKSKPDKDTLGARWFSIDEMRDVSMRGPEVRELLADVLNGAPVYPMTLIQAEGKPLL